jgi:vancomycin aglycone glucosyltransferase
VRFLLSAIGSRGEAQPLAGLAVALRAAGHRVRLCLPPDFRDWLTGLGFEVVPVGPELRTRTARGPAPTAAQLAGLAASTVAAQFDAVTAAAEGCDVLVAAGALQLAARSVAEARGLRYVYAAFCGVTLPSAAHPPLPVPGWDPGAGLDNAARWAADAGHWTERWGPPLNAHRAALGLPPVADVRGHVFTGRPWLAADPLLGPAAEPLPGSGPVFQPGAWLLPDDRPLPAELAAFLDAGPPPVYLGFGSVPAPDGLAAAVRALGGRVVLAGGWSGATVPGPDVCNVTGDVNQRALFGRVAAVVHHGGAGTTTAAALAGAPQVLLPQRYDQPYWADRVTRLGIGVRAAGLAALPGAVEAALAVRAGAAALAGRIRTDGASRTVDRLTAAE